MQHSESLFMVRPNVMHLQQKDPLRPNAHLLITAHFVRSGRVGGAEHMLYNLLNGMQANLTKLSVLCARKEDLDADFVTSLDQSHLARIVETGGQGSRFIAEQRACLDRTISGDAILFSNYFVPPLLPKRLGRTTVVLHDMQYRHFPQYFSAHKRAWLRAAHNLAVHRADKMVVISDFVRRDAIRWLGKSSDRKLKVIPNPISWERFGPASSLRPLDRPYILSVAAQYPHKNLEVLVRAFAEVCRVDRDVMLVLCGQPYSRLTGVAHGRGGLGDLISELGITDRIVATGYIDDRALGGWYRHAAAFAFPSIFEGFGMPAVEALGFGLPTILTKRTAMPESSLGFGVFVNNPQDVGEWASCLHEIIRNPQTFRQSADDVATLKDHYKPSRIAELYLRTCLG